MGYRTKSATGVPRQQAADSRHFLALLWFRRRDLRGFVTTTCAASALAFSVPAAAVPSARFPDIPSASTAASSPAPTPRPVVPTLSAAPVPRTPSPSEGFVRRLARAHLERGQELDQRGDITQALREYSVSLALDPSFGDAYLALGGLRARMGDVREAELVYGLATTLSDVRPRALLARARLRRETHELEGAQRDLEGAVEGNAEREALEELARSYVEQHAWCAALGVYRRIAATTLTENDAAAHKTALLEVQALRVLAAETDSTREPRPRHDWLGRALAHIAQR